ncbi:MAG TPA: hypothetical protein VKA94_12955, partial [Hyphomicrobiales bacterium]|nr:hypothetical protein [Hyphomicrobiales bacterium]
YAAAGLWAYVTSQRADGVALRLPENVRTLRYCMQVIAAEAGGGSRFEAVDDPVEMQKTA